MTKKKKDSSTSFLKIKDCFCMNEKVMTYGRSEIHVTQNEKDQSQLAVRNDEKVPTKKLTFGTSEDSK